MILLVDHVEVILTVMVFFSFAINKCEPFLHLKLLPIGLLLRFRFVLLPFPRYIALDLWLFLQCFLGLGFLEEFLVFYVFLFWGFLIKVPYQVPYINIFLKNFFNRHSILLILCFLLLNHLSFTVFLIKFNISLFLILCLYMMDLIKLIEVQLRRFQLGTVEYPKISE